MLKIEEEIFQKAVVDFDKIITYGFKKDNDIYKYSQNIMDNTLKVTIEINNSGFIHGKIFDFSSGDEYTNYRIESIDGAFVLQVREEFINILKDIKKKCYTEKLFINNQTSAIAEQIKKKYGTNPEFEWEKFPGFATFKTPISKKWYGIIMNLDKSKIKKGTKGEVEIINIKLEPKEIEELLKKDGFYPAYHMNKKNWITIILDNTLSDKDIMTLIDKSYNLSEGRDYKEKCAWLIPANPKYFDIASSLKKSNTLLWKQSTNIKIDDIVYVYLASPYSAIMYKFKVTKTNIPYSYQDKNIQMTYVMKLSLIKRYQKEDFPLKILNKFGITVVRGPRYMPYKLSEYISKKEQEKLAQKG